MCERLVAHYRVLDKLGQGGMGVVYKAEDTRLQRTVALKFLPVSVASDERKRQRFTREAMTASSLDHPNICTIHEIGTTDDGELFIAMTLYEGETLKDRLQKGALPVRPALQWVEQIAEGLAKAHSKDVIHRDIKPANLFITSDGFVKILDFGLARTRSDKTLTETGELLGTVPYMSPEQIAGQELDHRTDIWSLGVVFYEMLTGLLPFRGTLTATMLAIQGQEPIAVDSVRAGLPVGVTRIIERALAKDVDRRFQQVHELLSELRSAHELAPEELDATQPLVLSTRSVESAPSEPSLAILPFKNVGDDPEGEYFSDGLTDELIHALSTHAGIRVVSRTSVFKLKNSDIGLDEIARLLNVNSILEGSVRVALPRIRVLAQLVSVDDDRQLWSEKYDRNLEDVFSVQDEIASIIADRLKGALGAGSGSDRRTAYRGHIEAYQFYLKGRYFFNRRMLDKSLQCYELALERDPDFAPAHAGLASQHAAMGVYGGADPRQVWPRVRQSTHRALELDRDLAEAHIAMGFLRTFEDWDWEGAASAFFRALKLAPGSVDAHLALIMHLFQRGRFDAAWPYVQAAQKLDPLSAIARASEVAGHVYAGHYEHATDLYQKAQEIAQEALDLQLFYGLALQRLGRFDEALIVLTGAHEATGGGLLTSGFLGACYAEAGKRAEALEMLTSLEAAAEQAYVPPVTRALIHAALGDHDAALTALEDAASVRDALLCYAKVLPGLLPLHGDSRFTGLLDRMGLEAPRD